MRQGQLSQGLWHDYKLGRNTKGHNKRGTNSQGNVATNAAIVTRHCADRYGPNNSRHEEERQAPNAGRQYRIDTSGQAYLGSRRAWRHANIRPTLEQPNGRQAMYQRASISHAGNSSVQMMKPAPSPLDSAAECNKHDGNPSSDYRNGTMLLSRPGKADP
jgi:hypothetical protein